MCWTRRGTHRPQTVWTTCGILTALTSTRDVSTADVASYQNKPFAWRTAPSLAPNTTFWMRHERTNMIFFSLLILFRKSKSNDKQLPLMFRKNRKKSKEICSVGRLHCVACLYGVASAYLWLEMRCSHCRVNKHKQLQYTLIIVQYKIGFCVFFVFVLLYGVRGWNGEWKWLGTHTIISLLVGRFMSGLHESISPSMHKMRYRVAANASKSSQAASSR